MENSILNSIKKLLGAENITEFDDNLVMFINSSINTLTQNGIGPKTGFKIDGASQTWNQFITNSNPDLYGNVKEFIYLDVKMIFDPPIGSVMDFYKTRREEVLWRIKEQVDPADIFEVNDNG